MLTGQFGAFYFASLYLQGVLDDSPVETGLASVPFALGVIVDTIVAGRLMTRTGPRPLLVSGLVLRRVRKLHVPKIPRRNVSHMSASTRFAGRLPRGNAGPVPGGSGWLPAMVDDSLADFTATEFTHDGKTRAVYRAGTGPAVIVMAEAPGITPKVAGFARRVAEIGCTAVMPHLFGVPGKDPVAGGRLGFLRYTAASMLPVCVSREFTALATGRTSPVVSWLRALAADEHARCGGPGVGAVGMCFTGGFALAMATHPSLIASVLSQPSLPLPLTRGRKNTIDCSAADLEVVRQRCAAEDLEVLGLRFRGDTIVSPQRFQFLREQLGDAFVAVELDDGSANPAALTPPHSVLTEHLVDEPGQPTRAALDQVLDLFRKRLLPA